MSEAHSLQDLIIENAGALFRDRGYAATTIKEIAKASGCTTAALYYHSLPSRKDSAYRPEAESGVAGIPV